MPELPEVETIRRMLEPKIIGRTINICAVYLPRMIKAPAVAEFVQQITGSTILGLTRRGKFLLLKISTGLIVIHLRMTGRLVVRALTEAADKYRRVEFVLDNGTALTYADTRTLGTLHYFVNENEITINCLKTMGPEPLTVQFSEKTLYTAFNASARTVKALLLDQSVIGGLGNIYVDEALFAARIKPDRSGKSLTKKELKALFTAINQTISKAIANCGTSFRNYVDGEGNKGHNQDELFVYGRKKQPCFSCGTPLCYGRIAGRGTHWCEHCQK
ncbi:MAG: DNA-formamidopyrimidine glycosylase [Negativicutes bacterium]|jgi:formamidopyrimidine-DNA glycosylase